MPHLKVRIAVVQLLRGTNLGMGDQKATGRQEKEERRREGEGSRGDQKVKRGGRKRGVE